MRDLVKYLDYWFYLPAISLLPPGLAYRMAELRGDWMCRARKDSARHAIRNILAVFPSLTARQVSEIARGHYRALSVVEMEAFWFTRSAEFFQTHMTVEGLENLKSAAGRPGGALVLLPHWGSVATFFVSIGKRGISFYVVGRPIARQQDQLHPAHLKAARKCMADIGDAIGHPLLYTGRGGFSKMRELLQSGEILMTAFDVTPHILRNVQAVQFFGRTAYFPDGLAQLQQQTGARVFYGFILRYKQKPYQRIEIRRLPEAPAGGEQNLMQRLVSMLEQEIRKRPCQWTLWDSMEWFYHERA